jgi:hypothetical protein
VKERYGAIVTTVNLVFGPPYRERQERQRRMFRQLGTIMPAMKQI